MYKKEELLAPLFGIKYSESFNDVFTIMITPNP